MPTYESEDLKDRKKILLIQNDSPENARLLSGLLERGYEVSVADIGRVGASQLEDQAGIDLILIDPAIGFGVPGTVIPLMYLSGPEGPQQEQLQENANCIGFLPRNSGPGLVDASIRMALKLHARSIAKDVTDRRKVEEELRSLLAEKELLLKEVHHRIKNNMNAICSLLAIQAQTLSDPIAIEVLKDAGSRVQSMTVLYDKLYQSPKHDSIQVGDYLPALVEEIVSTFHSHTSIRIVTKIDAFTLDAARLQPIGIIINELVTNIMKYAFRGRAEGSIEVSARLDGTRVSIAVGDDGGIMPESIDFDESTGFGLLLVKMLTMQLDGAIRIERDEGTTVVLEFTR
jgi:two-component sensor histidine kinase